MRGYLESCSLYLRANSAKCARCARSAKSANSPSQCGRLALIGGECRDLAYFARFSSQTWIQTLPDAAAHTFRTGLAIIFIIMITWSLLEDYALISWFFIWAGNYDVCGDLRARGYQLFAARIASRPWWQSQIGIMSVAPTLIDYSLPPRRKLAHFSVSPLTITTWAMALARAGTNRHCCIESKRFVRVNI